LDKPADLKDDLLHKVMRRFRGRLWEVCVNTI
jgi:hypothetical protein